MLALPEEPARRQSYTVPRGEGVSRGLEYVELKTEGIWSELPVLWDEGGTGLNDVLKTQPYAGGRPLSSSGRKPMTHKRRYAAYDVRRLPTLRRAVASLPTGADPTRHLARSRSNRRRRSVPRTSSSGVRASAWTRSNPHAGTTHAHVGVWQVCLLGSRARRFASCAALRAPSLRRRPSPKASRAWRGVAVPAEANGLLAATS